MMKAKPRMPRELDPFAETFGAGQGSATVRQSMRSALAICFSLSVSLLSATAFAAKVVVIKSKDVAQYNQALDGFRAKLASKVETKEFSLDAGEAAVQAGVSGAAPDAIFAIGPAAAKLARTAFASVPLVYAVVPNPEGLGLKGANVTGVSMSVHPRKNFQLLKTMPKKVTRVGVIYNPAKSQDYVNEGVKAAEALGITLVQKTAEGEQDVPAQLRDMLDHIDAFWLLPDSTVVSRNSFKFILQNTLEKGVPLLVFSSELVKTGALFGLSPDFGDAGDKAAQLIEKVLSGAKAETLPVAYPEGRLEVNDQVAERMQVTLPADVLAKRGKIF